MDICSKMMSQYVTLGQINHHWDKVGVICNPSVLQKHNLTGICQNSEGHRSASRCHIYSLYSVLGWWV